MLLCHADGTKLKPAVEFKRKKMPKEKLPRISLCLFKKGAGLMKECFLDG